MAESDPPSETAFKPPYMSFKSLQNLLDQMAQDGIPDRIDRSYLTGKSGSVQAQLIGGLRVLGLIDEDDVPQPRLKEMASNPDRRQEIVSDLLSEFYAEPLVLSSRNATRAQLEEWIRESGITGQTIDKSISFFLQAAEYASISTSPNFKVGRRKGVGSRKRKPGNGTTTVDPSPPPAAPAAAGALMSDMQARYVDLLLKKLEAGDGLDADLLDRIEGLLFTPVNGEEASPHRTEV